MISEFLRTPDGGNLLSELHANCMAMERAVFTIAQTASEPEIKRQVGVAEGWRAAYNFLYKQRNKSHDDHPQGSQAR